MYSVCSLSLGTWADADPSSYASCPTECRLSSSDSRWQCTVVLVFVTDKNGLPFGQPGTIQFGPIIYDKGEVEDRIRRAQCAILNPSTPSKEFLTGSDEELSMRELGFSANYISLQISGKDVADLSFVDLPGVL